MKNTPKNAGNAFVIVLILIALLAALTITLTRMGSTTQEVSQEQAQTIASQVLRQGRSMANAVDGLVAKGCSQTQFSFENPFVAGYTNAQSPSDKSCWLFDQAGAGMAWPTPPSNANNGTAWVINTFHEIQGVGPERETNVLCTVNCADLLMILPLVNLQVCQAINLLAGVTTSLSTAPPVAAATFDAYRQYAANASPTVYNFSIGSAGVNITDSGRLTWDKKAACMEAGGGYLDSSGALQSGTGKYIFYQVLLER